MSSAKFLFLFLFILSSCGYRFDGPAAAREGMTMSIPYVQGDIEGQLTDALVKAVASSGAFDYRANDGQLILKVEILSQDNQKTGFRYLRQGDSGERKKNLVTTEARKEVAAEVTVIDACSQEVLLGPTIVTAFAEYDFIDPTSVNDLLFTSPDGFQQPSINFSLGQLDANEGAQDDVLTPLYRHLAQKIIDGMRGVKW